MVDPNTRQGKRTPVTLKIKFKSETLEQFIERYAVDVSQGGIFIRTKEPLAVGTQMKFEFQLRDASPLIGGEGTVVWTRENDPSRPAIAPGMGVRFDRLAEGSQNVLERILSEKAKQAPSRPSEVTKPPMFTDTPTRVAPAPVQDALLGRQLSNSGRTRADSFSETSSTPLPRPMPFHSDADDFDERAFEEATKVRSLDELAAASAGLDNRENNEATRTAVMVPGPESRREDDPFRSRPIRADSTIAEPPEPAEREERTVAGVAVARTGSIQPPRPIASGPSVLAFADDAEPSRPGGMIDRDSAPGLPSPPESPKSVEVTPSGLASSAQPVRTQLGMEMPRVTTKERDTVAPPVEVPSIKDSPSRATGLAAVSSPKASAREPAARAASSQHMPASRRPSSAPIIIGILVALAGIGAAVWYFVLRPDGSDVVVTRPTPPTPGSDIASSAPVTPPTPPPDNGSAGSAVANTGSAGSAGSAAVQTPPPPVKDTVDTVIASSIEKATVEIIGESQTGPVPFTAKLEKGKAYKVKVSAPRYADKTLDVKGGDPKVVAKLDPKPATIHVESEPAGALVFVDNAATSVKTPGDVTLTAAQAARKIVHVQVRMAGKKPFDQVVETSSLADSGDKLTASVDAGKLAVQVIVQRPPPPPNGNGSGAGSSEPANGSGSEKPPVEKPPVEKPPETPPTPTPPAGGTEPEPDWTKKN